MARKQTDRRDSKGHILEKGEGQRKDGRYYYAWTDALGDRHFIYSKSLDNLRQRRKEIARDVLSGVRFDKSSMTLNQAIDYWTNFRKADISIGALKPTTLCQYLRSYDNHARRSIGKLKIKDITKIKLEAFYKSKVIEGLGISSVANIAKPISQTLAIAEEEGWIRRNPSKGAMRSVVLASKKAPESKTPKIKALTPEEQSLLLGWLEQRRSRLPLYCIVNILLYTGMRVGELGGLQVSSISDGFVTIRHSLAYFSLVVDGKSKMIRKMQEPKTRAGVRTIPLLEPSRKALAQYRGWMRKHGITLTQPVDGFSDFAFLTRKGFPLTDAGINSALARAIESINEEQRRKGERIELPRISCHWLRRTFATRLCEAGVSLRVAQYLLGHENINMTANVYTAVQSETARSEMSKILDTGASPTLTPVQQTYNKFSSIRAL